MYVTEIWCDCDRFYGKICAQIHVFKYKNLSGPFI